MCPDEFYPMQLCSLPSRRNALGTLNACIHSQALCILRVPETKGIDTGPFGREFARLFTAVIAQLVRAQDCGSWGRGFESRWPPHSGIRGGYFSDIRWTRNIHPQTAVWNFAFNLNGPKNSPSSCFVAFCLGICFLPARQAGADSSPCRRRCECEG